MAKLFAREAGTSQSLSLLQNTIQRGAGSGLGFVKGEFFWNWISFYTQQPGLSKVVASKQVIFSKCIAAAITRRADKIPLDSNHVEAFDGTAQRRHVWFPPPPPSFLLMILRKVCLCVLYQAEAAASLMVTEVETREADEKAGPVNSQLAIYRVDVWSMSRPNAAFWNLLSSRMSGPYWDILRHFLQSSLRIEIFWPRSPRQFWTTRSTIELWQEKRHGVAQGPQWWMRLEKCKTAAKSQNSQKCLTLVFFCIYIYMSLSLYVFLKCCGGRLSWGSLMLLRPKRQKIHRSHEVLRDSRECSLHM